MRNRSAPQTKKTFGGCKFGKISPKPPEGKTYNVIISFEEGLKLQMAVSEALRRLNSYHRSTTEGKRSALLLAVDCADQRVRVLESRL